MTQETDAKWKFGDTGRRATTDRDRVMGDEEANAYNEYIRPIMHERASETIDRHNAEYCKLSLEVRAEREKNTADYYRYKPKRLKKK